MVLGNAPCLVEADGRSPRALNSNPLYSHECSRRKAAAKRRAHPAVHSSTGRRARCRLHCWEGRASTVGCFCLPERRLTRSVAPAGVPKALNPEVPSHRVCAVPTHPHAPHCMRTAAYAPHALVAPLPTSAEEMAVRPKQHGAASCAGGQCGRAVSHSPPPPPPPRRPPLASCSAGPPSDF